MSIITTSFTRFGDLPKELRLNIWTLALPGPRLILVERHLFDKAVDKLPHGTYFSSPSYSSTSLLLACYESRQLFKKHYTLIFPQTLTWIDLSIGFLYIDFGAGCRLGEAYQTEHFRPGNFIDHELDTLEPPIIGAEIAGRVKNLAVHYTRRGEYTTSTKEIARPIACVFYTLDVLVLVDQFHHRNESGEDLVWFQGGLGEAVQEASSTEEELQTSWDFRLPSQKLILWTDQLEYGLCFPFNLQHFRQEWQASIDSDSVRSGIVRHVPKIVRKSVVSATLLNQLVKICGSREDIKQLEYLSWDYVLGNHQFRFNDMMREYEWASNLLERRSVLGPFSGYNGALSPRQQVVWLRLLLDRTFSDFRVDSVGETSRAPLTGSREMLIARINVLIEPDLRGIIIREAENIN